MVPGAGIEPARPKPPDFKSGMSTNFIIRAQQLRIVNCLAVGFAPYRYQLEFFDYSVE